MVSDRNDTATTLTTPNTTTQGITAATRYTDPLGNARGTTQAAIGNGAFTTAPAAARGVGSNDANPAGFGAVNGYIGGLADTQTQLTHLGARDLNPVLGAFTAPDPVLRRRACRALGSQRYSESGCCLQRSARCSKADPARIHPRSHSSRP